MLRIVQVFDQIHNIVGIHLAHSFGQRFRTQHGNHVFAQALFEFRQDFPIKLAIIELDQPAPVIDVDLFQKVRDVCRVHVL